MNELRPIEVGDRFETLDDRDAGRVVEITQFVDGPRYPSDPRGSRWYAKTEANPKNPDAVGNVSRISERTLRAKYRRISR